MSLNIAIVGGGASCVSFIDNFIKECNNTEPLAICFLVIEKSEEIGPGNAYRNDIESNILNTKAENITIFRDSPGDFYKWLVCCENKWRVDFANLKVKRDSYLPRALFGIYMKDAFEKICKHAHYSGFEIKKIKGEAVSIDKLDEHEFVISLSDGEEVYANKIILACGNLNGKGKDYSKDGDFMTTPFPTKFLPKKIMPYDNVGIVGSRLSAIDSVISLIESGHRGKITLFSRSGNFPFVRGTQKRYKNLYLNRSFISSNFNVMDFKILHDLYNKEIDNYKKTKKTQDGDDLPINFKPISSLASFLQREINLSSGPRAWQAILYDTNDCIDLIWSMFSKKDKELFLASYFSNAMSMRVSIPRVNALKILDYIKSGQLSYVHGEINPSIFFKSGMCFHDGGSYLDKILYATGSPRYLDDCDSVLFSRLLEGKVISRNYLGGLNVCRSSYRIISDSGVINSSIFAIGEVTNGTFLFTSALDIITRHAKECARSLLELILSEVNEDGCI
ncbi:FAD/NAD(P)-binding protein [Erwinia sp. Leaf53]|uniref:FAD/NAD(P)-binding protein n=1 Tax=Erwinia sp. Leaf53 TaxID=1736225 RepID=UPI00092E908F|nr:FAD/NAD(P)-binding domain-containing protein [Erwinia sp. Leaf53]